MSQKEENEVTIAFTEADEEVRVFISSTSWHTKARKAGFKIIKENSDGSIEYICKKSQISFRQLTQKNPNKPKRIMTEEQIKAMQEGRKKKTKKVD